MRDLSDLCLHFNFLHSQSWFQINEVIFDHSILGPSWEYVCWGETIFNCSYEPAIQLAEPQFDLTEKMFWGYGWSCRTWPRKNLWLSGIKTRLSLKLLDFHRLLSLVSFRTINSHGKRNIVVWVKIYIESFLKIKSSLTWFEYRKQTGSSVNKGEERLWYILNIYYKALLRHRTSV